MDRRVLVWDVPTRVFHWVLAVSFFGAFAIANLVEDESAVFAWHMFLGGVIGFSVLWRIVWGFVGSRWARFGALRLWPSEVLGYLGDVFRGEARRYAGHNPASSAISVVILVFGLAMPTTGLLMATLGESIAEVHEWLAWGFAASVAVHLGGILVYTFQHEDSIAMSMLDGRKAVDPDDGIDSPHVAAGLIFVVLTGLWSWGLVANYDTTTRQLTVPVVGTTIQIGEDEEHEHGEDEATETEREVHE